MKVDKMSVSFEATLGIEIRDAARRSGKSLSGWLGEAAADKLRSESLASFLDDWQAEHGAFTAEEIAQAEEDLGFRPRTDTAA